jgi:hypothetical protein
VCFANSEVLLMDAVTLITNRISAVNASVHGLIKQAAGLDLVQPVLPGTSPLGLTLWHLPRVQDWLVNTTIRAVPEVVEDFGGLPDPGRFGFGTGLMPDDAADAARAVDLDVLLSYSDAVTAGTLAWLPTLSPDDLDWVPPFAERQQTRASYCTPAALAEVAGLHGVPVGVLLMRPAIAHVFHHAGELEVLMSVAASAT